MGRVYHAAAERAGAPCSITAMTDAVVGLNSAAPGQFVKLVGSEWSVNFWILVTRAESSTATRSCQNAQSIGARLPLLTLVSLRIIDVTVL